MNDLKKIHYTKCNTTRVCIFLALIVIRMTPVVSPLIDTHVSSPIAQKFELVSLSQRFETFTLDTLGVQKEEEHPGLSASTTHLAETEAQEVNLGGSGTFQQTKRKFIIKLSHMRDVDVEMTATDSPEGLADGKYSLDNGEFNTNKYQPDRLGERGPPLV
ncbi:MAG: hypothetical protein AAF639_32620 [Chloroflexota bacterium]